MNMRSTDNTRCECNGADVATALTADTLERTRPLESLTKLGFAVELGENHQLKVKPARRIDESVHEFIIASKRLVIMELTGLAVTCTACGRTVAIVYQPDIFTTEDAGLWFSTACGCGHEAYVCERDYWHWRMGNRRSARR